MSPRSTFRLIVRFGIILLILILISVLVARAPRTSRAVGQPTTAYPILFVTQLPIAGDFTTIGSTFGNHKATMQSVGRGGDLWIRYPDGTLKNLTQAAGYGVTGFQDDNAIAVRDPSVHWDGNKAIFSMVIGAPEIRYQWETYYWQLYEITGLGLNDTPVITKVPNQPENFNNISPIYGTDDRIIFTSDRPRNGHMHLYPQLDEYESAPTNTGLWSLNPATGDLRLLNHAPSGDFTPTIDSDGRVLFTQWDHLQQDQQADADRDNPANPPYGSFNYSDESANATILNSRAEVFPEPREAVPGTNIVGHTINHFFPWTINQDGTDGEILLHLGRHELHSYIPNAISDDPNIVEFYNQYPRTNPNSILNMFQIKEDPLSPGTFWGVDAPEFYTHAAGNIIRLATAGLNADQVVVEYATDVDHGDGRYREPLPLSDGTLLAIHTDDSGYETGNGVNSSYEFRLKLLAPTGGGQWAASTPLTSGISKEISFWDPDNMVTFNGVLWELNPVEVRPRSRPTPPTFTLPAPEQQMFDQAGVSLAELQAFMAAHGLALVVSRDVTTRDDLDRQQPFNLRVPGGAQTIGAPGQIYDVRYLQFFQGLQIRGYTWGGDTPRDGRRLLAQPDGSGYNPPNTGPTGSVTLGSDGSMAAFVPAGRALTWQLTDPEGESVVRERYWLTFAPGEVRVCTSCHGLSDLDQAGHTAPTNPPQALLDLLEWWQTMQSLTPQAYLPAVMR
ncbi:MAG: hypothetical protein HND44_14240 [Chloroflexi bacterium]|nr:hypothetical protein [Ardenticatenaceae bacterium]MBL1129637.1 hypothetical protein [Chloroflexota bacterium]NOG35717.1 hypothetical protein [Chloroflexota bacterium]GIK55957.1 MAG: hypothetical protein BroJett015_16200 [Chloroflexota bacterium]